MVHGRDKILISGLSGLDLNPKHGRIFYEGGLARSNDYPSPATHAILLQLKAGEIADLLYRV